MPRKQSWFNTGKINHYQPSLIKEEDHRMVTTDITLKMTTFHSHSKQNLLENWEYRRRGGSSACKRSVHVAVFNLTVNEFKKWNVLSLKARSEDIYSCHS